MKKALATLSLILALLPTSLLAQEQIVIGMTVPGLQFPFFVAMKADAEAAAAKLGIKLLFNDAQDSSDKQMAALENFASQKVNGILISPMTSDSLVPAIEEAANKGIPVATVDEVLKNALVGELTPIEWDEHADLQAAAVATPGDEDDVGGVLTH